ncbi:MAG TPA: choice-of-anchor tandem repeat GloVer-containing protein [Terriglobales bacterium]
MFKPALFLSFVLLSVFAFAANKPTVTVLHEFKGTNDGAYPTSGLNADAAGNLYGATQEAGSGNAGTIYRFIPDGNGGWMFEVIYAFTGGADGGSPLGTLVFDAQGNGYGTAASGGANGLGVVYKLTPPKSGKTWTETVLYSFKGDTDGQLPFGEVVFDAAGNLYGTTSRGGMGHVGCFQAGCGTIYELTPRKNGTWGEAVLHRFSDAFGQGAEPRDGLVFDAAGNLYGTTNSGGNNDACNTFNSDGCGEVFELVHVGGGQWQLVTIRDFNDTDGGNPRAGVTLDGKGNLYGVTTIGGNLGGGTLFSFSQQNGKWVNGKGINFPHESQPSGRLALDQSGMIYGTTYEGGAHVAGSVFQLDPATWKHQTIYSFPVSGPGTGTDPQNGVFLQNGAIFVTTTNGGDLNACSPNPGCGAVVMISTGGGAK